MRTWRVIAVVSVAALVLVSCSSGDDGQLDLDADDGQAAAEVTEPPGEVEEPDQPDDPDDPDEPSVPTDDDEPLYPPLPPLEPDPDSDIPLDQQQSFLAIHNEVYEATQSALASTDSDLEGLADVLAEPLLTEFIRSVQERRKDGLVSRAPDTTIEWVRITDVRNGPFDVQECRIVGPETGLYEVDGGSAVDVGTESVAVIFQTTYELTEVDDDMVYRAVEIISGGDDERCHA